MSPASSRSTPRGEKRISPRLVLSSFLNESFSSLGNRRQSKELLKNPVGLNPPQRGGVLLPEPRMNRGSIPKGVVMKKKLGVLVLTLSTLVISAACTTVGQKPNPKPEPDSGEYWGKGESWGKVGPSVRPGQPAKAAALTGRPGSPHGDGRGSSTNNPTNPDSRRKNERPCRQKNVHEDRRRLDRSRRALPRRPAPGRHRRAAGGSRRCSARRTERPRPRSPSSSSPTRTSVSRGRPTRSARRRSRRRWT